MSKIKKVENFEVLNLKTVDFRTDVIGEVDICVGNLFWKKKIRTKVYYRSYNWYWGENTDYTISGKSIPAWLGIEGIAYIAIQEYKGGTAGKFNINQTVKVKLTDVGRKELQRQDEEFKREHPNVRYEGIIVEDQHGWSTFQMWDLMQRLGHLCGPGSEPFEADIKVLKK